SVPAADGERHAPHAGFDQAAGAEEILVALVAIEAAWLLATQVEGPADRPRGDDVEGPARDGVKATKVAADVEVAANLVKVGQQGAPIVEAVQVDALGQPQIGTALVAGCEGAVSSAEKTGLLAVRLSIQAHEGRDVGRAGPYPGKD